MRQINKCLFIFFMVVFYSLNNYAQADPPAELKTIPAEVEIVDVNKPEKKIEQYWFVMLKTVSRQDFDSIRKAKLFDGHMANITRLYNEGILKVSGPFGKNDFKWSGIFIFDCKTKEEVEAYISKDPAIAAGLLAVDIVPWYSEPIGSFVHGKPKNPIDNVDHK
ncbi:MAG: YciI family protein [Ferruginibacter sp.]